ncbi:MarR family winged helix-turn-helix transcriptional regulator [Actinophytocola oryzae]|uniref:DNA-binding MarR family transcriptional regulator n=1 Tax=Actinophytocola oryzae TaxID=502181 RepID=A0A4R7W331_9PSEU|nr:MarR family transcriptional regulator [Actinophytocola oryzae]TDV56565.1 DNA-binding MarR family transcriptional regulator [Actinophytocola oryzae]
MESDRIEVLIGGGFNLAHRYARAATNRALRELGLDLRHLGVLGQLAQLGPVPQQALVDRLQLDKSSMVYVIDELERQGLAERRRSEEDRRRYAVHLTELGRTRLGEATTVSAEAMADLLTPFTAAEREQLHELLTRFVAHAATPVRTAGARPGDD